VLNIVLINFLFCNIYTRKLLNKIAILFDTNEKLIK